MSSSELSDELRRLINSIASIPHLEVMLLLHETAGQVWNVTSVAKRIYVNPARAEAMLDDLCEVGLCKCISSEAGEYLYAPASEGLGRLIDQLADYYPRNLIQVTNMIHAKSTSGRRVQMFADAFKFNKDK